MGWDERFKWLLSRVFVLVAFLYLGGQVLVDFKTTRLKVLNDSQPSFENFVDFALNPSKEKAAALEPYTRYLRISERYLPQGPVPAGLLGYCYYYLGNTQKAIKQFSRATELEPKCFWFFYDLGVVYFNEGRYGDAAKYLAMAVSMPAKPSALFMNISKMYRDVLSFAVVRGVDPTVGLMEAYPKAKEILDEAIAGNPLKRRHELRVF